MIEIRVKILKNLFEKIIGLTGKNKPFPVMMKTRFGIHTFGVKFPIDVLILDNNYTVVKFTKNLKPDNVFLWNPIFDIVLELPAGTIEKKSILKGNKIRIITEN